MKKIITLLFTIAIILTLVSCGNSSSSKDEKKIKVACSPTPHGEILNQAKSLLAEKGYELEIIEFEDYVQPIEVVESNEIDANYFAHVPYLDNYNSEKGTNQVVVGKIHYEPFGLYPGLKKSLSDIVDNDVIFVPNDGTNETRALLLLKDLGLIVLNDNVSADSIVTVNDIVSYNVKVDIRELEAAQIARVKDEAAAVVLNGNYALAANLNVLKDALAYEQVDSSAAQTYVNVVAVKKGNENNEGVNALVEVLKSQEIVDYINKTYEGAVVPFVE